MKTRQIPLTPAVPSDWPYRLLPRDQRGQWVTEDGPFRQYADGIYLGVEKGDHVFWRDKIKGKRRCELVRQGFFNECRWGYTTTHSLVMDFPLGLTYNPAFLIINQTHTTDLDPGFWIWNVQLNSDRMLAIELVTNSHKRYRLPLSSDSRQHLVIETYWTTDGDGYAQ